MKRTKYLVDVDGVCADFIGHLLTATGSKLTREDITEWDCFSALERECRDRAFNEILVDPMFWRTIPPFPQSQREVELLRHRGDVVFCTSPWASHTEGWMCKGWGWARNQWLREHFGCGLNDLVITYAKYHVNGDVLVDDRYKNVALFKEHNPDSRAILLRNQHNRNDPWDDCCKINGVGWVYNQGAPY